MKLFEAGSYYIKRESLKNVDRFTKIFINKSQWAGRAGDVVIVVGIIINK